MGDPKSQAGKRRIKIPPPYLEVFREHREAQQLEREKAGSAWEDHGLVWCQWNGRPIGPERDRDEWRAVLAEVGVRSARVHDQRHTAATMMLILGEDPVTVMAVMGWSDPRMLKRYQHVVDEILGGVADRIGGLLEGGSATHPATGRHLKIVA
jgi:integrase